MASKVVVEISSIKCENSVLRLPFPFRIIDYLLNIPSLLSKWKNLEFLRLGGSFQMKEVLAQINIHCKNFIGLDITKANIGDFEASAIVTLLPNIKQLYLRNATMEKEHLVMILKGCRELEYVDVRKCIGFDAYDDEILKLASQIPTFINEGSMFDYYDVYIPPYHYGYYDDNPYHCDYHEVYDCLSYCSDGFYDGNYSD
ncbi:hypothetical protein ACSBR2_030634 [Camellia fascicularis]